MRRLRRLVIESSTVKRTLLFPMCRFINYKSLEDNLPISCCPKIYILSSAFDLFQDFWAWLEEYMLFVS
ncbi:hypothetical protein TNCV_4054751 [Trichonephila clavipes]|nr:hypothetical protein TNCV_4054751 [Trichonephila clavipes]